MSEVAEQQYLDKPSSIVTGILLYMAAPAGMSLLPLLVGAAADFVGLSEREVGFLASADLAGIAVTAILATIWIRRVPWRSAAFVGITTVVVANGLCMFANSFIALALLRFLTELGSGILFSLAIVTIGDTRKPDRYYAIGIGLTVLLSTIYYIVLPPLIQEHGIGIVFLSHALIAAAIFPAMFWQPQSGVERVTSTTKESGSLVPLFIAVAGFTLFTAAEGGVWAYLERIGVGGGFGSEFVGKALALTQVASVAGAIVASVLSTRFGRVLPLLVGLGLFILSLAFLINSGASMYVAAASLSQFCYIFVVPYFLLLCVELDPTGRYYVAATAFKMGGMAMGPSVVALFLTGNDYAVVAWVGSTCLMLSALLVIPLAYSLDRRTTKHGEAAPQLAEG